MDINILRADLKGIERELKRMNDLFELVVTQTLGLHLAPLEKQKDASDVIYSSDLETFKNELIDLNAGKNPFRPIGVDDDD